PVSSHFFFLMLRPLPSPTLFPYTTLFRSGVVELQRVDEDRHDDDVASPAGSLDEGQVPRVEVTHRGPEPAGSLPDGACLLRCLDDLHRARLLPLHSRPRAPGAAAEAQPPSHLVA